MSSIDVASAAAAGIAGPILITGSAGFLGRALARRLMASADDVIGLDRIAAEELSRGTIIADLVDAAAVLEAFERVRPRTVFHLGGISGRAVSRDEPWMTVRTNVMGTANVLEAARTVGRARVVVSSSGSVYGASTADPVQEDLPLVPLNAYGASKVGAEALVHAYGEDWGVDAVALRIFQVYGPQRATRCHLKMMLQGALAQRPAEISHRADSRRQYIYVDDAVDALLTAASARTLSRRTYNISGADSLTLAEIAAIVAQVFPGFEARFGNDPLSREYCLGAIDMTAARRDLRFDPRVGLRLGLTMYADWLRHHDV